MKHIDWNQASELGLIVRINREILHPMGLAMSRNPETGVSEVLFISPDGVWEYDKQFMSKSPQIIEEDVRAKIVEWTKELQA